MYIPGSIILLFVRTKLDAVVLNDDSYNVSLFVIRKRRDPLSFENLFSP